MSESIPHRPSTLEVAGAAARDALAQFGLVRIRIWLIEPPTVGDVVLAGNAGAQTGALLPGLSEAEIRDAARAVAPRLDGVSLGIPLDDGDDVFGYVECLSVAPFGLGEAASIEGWAKNLTQILIAANATSELEAEARGHVLIADDDPGISRLLEMLLTRNGFQVTSVANGLLACEAAAKIVPDLVLLDWMMPVLDGRSAASRLKNDERTHHIPIVMLTSQARMEDKIAALEAGAQDYLTKPFDSRELVARISQQMRWRKLLASDTPGRPAASSAPDAAPAAQPQSIEPVAAVAPRNGDYWSAAVEAQQLGKLREALSYYIAEAERCEDGKLYPRAAIAFRSASVVAGQLQNLDLSNKFLRLAGKMYLCWAESSHDGKSIADAYVNAARCFLSAGNLKLARKSVEIAESMHSVMADDRPSAL